VEPPNSRDFRLPDTHKLSRLQVGPSSVLGRVPEALQQVEIAACPTSVTEQQEMAEPIGVSDVLLRLLQQYRKRRHR